MTEERLKEIEEGVAHEIRLNNGWEAGSQMACRQLAAEVRRLQRVVVQQNLDKCSLRGAMAEALPFIQRTVGNATAIEILKEALR